MSSCGHVDHGSGDEEIISELRHLARPTELAQRSVWPGLGAIGFNWLVIGAALAVMAVAPWPAHPFLVLIIAARQHALLVIMHDGSHFLLCTNKRWNDLLSDCLCAFPFGITTRDYRTNHLAHHQHLNTPADPDLVRKAGPSGKVEEWLFPQPIRRMTWLLLRDVLGVGVVYFAMGLRDLRRAGRKETSALAEYPLPNVLRLTLMVTLAGVIVVSGRPVFFLYAWLVPLLLVLPAILRLRSVAEHFALPRQHVLNSTRNIHVTWWESFMLALVHSLHLDHHLFPYVPWYRLPELHRRLSASGIYQSLAHNNLGFIAGSQSVLANVASIVDDPRTALAPTLTSRAAGA